MAELYDLGRSMSLTPIVESCVLRMQPNLVTNYALDGTFYIQVLGEAAALYDVVCYAPRVPTTFIESGYAEGHIFRVTMSSGTYYGICVEFNKSYLLNDYFKIEMTLAYVPNPESQNEP